MQRTYPGDGKQCVHLVVHDTSFTGNTCRAFARAGLRLRATNRDISITGNTFLDGERGIYTDPASPLDHPIISGNSVRNMSQEGLAFTAALTDAVINGNNIDGVAVHGFSGVAEMDFTYAQRTALWAAAIREKTEAGYIS